MFQHTLDSKIPAKNIPTALTTDNKVASNSSKIYGDQSYYEVPLKDFLASRRLVLSVTT